MSCSETTLIDEQLPSLENLSPETIDTKLPVINVQVDVEEFKNLYTNFHDKISIEAEVSLSNVTSGFNQKKALINIKGFGSKYFDLKSLGIIFKNPVNNINHQIIDIPNSVKNNQLDHLSSIRLRNSGMDFMWTMIKDMSYTQFASNLDLDLEMMYCGSTAQIFVNEEYYGLLNIRNESNIEALGQLWDVEPSEITLFSLNSPVGSNRGKLKFRSGDAILGDLFLNAIKQKDHEVLWDILDIPNFLDYIIYEDYIGNSDWPYGNVRVYSYPGGKLRFFLYDVDLAAFRNQNPRIPELEYLPFDLAKIYRILRDVDKDRFDDMVLSRQKQLYEKIKVEDFNAIVDSFALRIQNDINYQIVNYGFPKNKIEWYKELDLLKRDFERRDYFIRKKYDL